MSNYFSYFPKVSHDLSNEGKDVLLTNVMRRFKIRSEAKGASSTFHEYNINEGERPDTIADKYYGSSSYSWIVLHYNDIIDPVFGWPIFGNDLDKFIAKKYGSIPAAKTEVHEYRKKLADKKVLFDGTIIPERYVVIDKTTYDATLPSVRSTVTKFDYEIELQEQKRKIKLLDKKYLPKIRAEVEDILRNGV
jgi:hypothetical protein